MFGFRRKSLEHMDSFTVLKHEFKKIHVQNTGYGSYYPYRKFSFSMSVGHLIMQV